MTVFVSSGNSRPVGLYNKKIAKRKDKITPQSLAAFLLKDIMPRCIESLRKLL
jgi:hypothetical protein